MFNLFNKFKKQETQEQTTTTEEKVTAVEENQITEQPQQVDVEDSKKGFGISFSHLRDTLSKTSESLVGSVTSLLGDNQEIDDDLLDEMEERLIRADLGLSTTLEIIEKIRKNKNSIKADGLSGFLKNEFSSILSSTQSSQLNIKDDNLNIILITGVNGAGKTTLIGKLANRFRLQGKKVLVAAGDTFRAAAEDQLEIWTNRAGAEIVRRDGADPASVVFDAIKKAKEENANILLVDTAGRLQNKFNLMEELGKIKKVIDREAPECLAESMLVLDANTGQNGLKQAEVFKESVQLTSVALTKLDGTAKGGVIIAIAKDFNLPVKLIGVGEKLEDLKDFNPNDYVNALFSK